MSYIITMSKNYRKLYENTHGKITDNWEVHHIDWNHENNDINNLIAIPIKVHQLIHGYLGYTDREEIINLIELFTKNKNYRNKSVSYLNNKLKYVVNTNKDCELSISCRSRLDNQIENYHKYLTKYKKKTKLELEQARVEEYRKQMMAPKEKKREILPEDFFEQTKRIKKPKKPLFRSPGQPRRLRKL